jgi:Protein of unknown function (DUF3617)
MRFSPLFAFFCFSLPAAALDAPAKPGLWETVLKNRQIETAVDQPIARFGKNKTPEPQSGAVSASVSASVGTSNSSAGLIEKVCVTSEALKTVGMPAPIRSDCDYKTRWAGSVATIQTFCNGVVTSGEVNYPSNDAYSGWILPSAPWGMGRIEISGRWLGADCGAVKP